MKYTLLLIFAIISLSYSRSDLFIWDYFRRTVGLSEKATAALMGNLYAESGLESILYDIAYHPQLGLTNLQYVKQVDLGEYPEEKFINDNIGFGIAQWKDITRKEGLYNLCRGTIGHLPCQISYIYEELKSDYRNAFNCLTEDSSIMLYTIEVMSFYLDIDYLDPEEIKRRTQFSENYYNKYANNDK